MSSSSNHTEPPTSPPIRSLEPSDTRPLTKTAQPVSEPKPEPEPLKQILITGTGRCGTTFLTLLFTFLDYDTGFTRDNYNTQCKQYNCKFDPVSRGGLETVWLNCHYIVKNPYFMSKSQMLLEFNRANIKQIIIPVRDYTLSAKSREKYGNKWGGLWDAKNAEEQVQFYHKIMAEFILLATKYEMNTLFLDFDKMVSDKTYLFQKIKHILDEKNISFDTFAKVYDEVSVISKVK